MRLTETRTETAPETEAETEADGGRGRGEAAKMVADLHLKALVADARFNGLASTAPYFRDQRRK